MNITKIHIKKYTDDYKIKNRISKNSLANIDLVIDYDIAVNDIQLMDGKKGVYLRFPDDDKGRHIAFPINEETRQEFLSAIMFEYENMEE